MRSFRQRVHPQTVFTLFLLATFGWAIIEGLKWSPRTRFFPMLVAIPMLVLAAYQLWRDLTGRSLAEDQEHREAGGEAPAPAGPEVPPREMPAVVAQFLSFFLCLWLLGFMVTVPLFTFAYLRLVSRDSRLLSAVFAAAVWLFTWALFDRLLHLPLPQGVLFKML